MLSIVSLCALLRGHLLRNPLPPSSRWVNDITVEESAADLATAETTEPIFLSLPILLSILLQVIGPHQNSHVQPFPSVVLRFHGIRSTNHTHPPIKLCHIRTKIPFGQRSNGAYMVVFQATKKHFALPCYKSCLISLTALIMRILEYPELCIITGVGIDGSTGFRLYSQETCVWIFYLLL